MQKCYMFINIMKFQNSLIYYYFCPNSIIISPSNRMVSSAIDNKFDEW